MKKKTARIWIGRKIDDWLKTITNPQVKALVEKNVIVTGGCIVSLLRGEPVNDVDVYLRTFEATKALAEYYVDQFKKNPPPKFASGKAVAIKVVAQEGRVRIRVQSAGVAGELSGETTYSYFEAMPTDEEAVEFAETAVEEAKEDKGKPKYRPIFLTDNAITLSHGIQIITRFYGEPATIHSTYDFVHCTCYWDSNTRVLYCNPEALECILAKELRYMGQSQYPICALVRVRKFVQRGWSITAGQLLKIAMDIHKLDLEDMAVLEDQLTGVDTAYFYQLLSALRGKDPTKVDSAYLMELVDKIF